MAWLERHLQDPGVLVLDVRWYLDGRPGADAYREGHIPGAVFVDLERDLTGPKGPGRHPLPRPEDFAAAMGRLGVGREGTVVAYDDAGGSVAARLWWLLKLHGHRHPAVLDGGLQAWTGQLQPGWVEPSRGDFEPEPGAGRGRILDWEAVREAVARGEVVLDARAPERYRGETEPVDARAGHIPGARNAFWRGSLDAEGRFLPAERLQARFRELGVGDGPEPVFYCGSGVTACHGLLSLEVAGLGTGRLYAGSWSDWSSRDLPVATGDEHLP